MDNFKIIYKILKYLEQTLDCDEVDLDYISPNNLGISENRHKAIIKMLIDTGYIDGFLINNYVGGNYAIKPITPTITIKGLEYLQENGMMKKASNLAKGIIEIL